MNLFIDTNILLNFFQYSKDRLEELEKVFVLRSYGRVNLWLPDQVQEEFLKRREAVIADALKRFRDEKPNSGIPNVVRGYPECDELVDALQRVASMREKLLSRVLLEISEKTLFADKLIGEIFSKSTRIELDERQFMKAKRRAELGRPPGKRDSLGDAINWEALLAAIPAAQDVHLVSEDGDYSSPLEPDRLSDFLSSEWMRRKGAKAHLYKRLSSFLLLTFPDAKIAADLEKDILISELNNSGKFAKTLQLVKALDKFPSFTSNQASQIADAYVTNTQIYWIALEADVQAFGRKILDGYGSSLDPAQAKAFRLVLMSGRRS